jgi:sugar lactone lactonase YvrE
MKRFFLGAVCPAMLALGSIVSACSGSRSGTGLIPSLPSSPQPLPIVQACTNVALPINTLTVDTQGDSAVRVFASGSTTSLATLFGPQTQISQPLGIIYGPSGLYVVSMGSSAVLVFAVGANGNCAPLRSIQGPNTEIPQIAAGDTEVSIAGIALDAAGNIYVAATKSNTILVFAPDASGNESPIRTISGSLTGLGGPRQIIFDASGNLWVANRTANTITAYAPGASGNVAPFVKIAGSATGLNNPWGIVFDRNGCLWVAEASQVNTLAVFMPPFGGNQAPTQVITGSNTGMQNPYGETLDQNGNVVVANKEGENIEVFSESATGNTAPILTIPDLPYPPFVVFRP